MKTDFIYLKGILKKHNNNFFDTSCWEINRILYDQKYLNLSKLFLGDQVKNCKDKFKCPGQCCKPCFEEKTTTLPSCLLSVD